MPQPACCPDVYYCPAAGEVECPRHGGFTVCCGRPDAHVPQDREAWHREQDLLERAWLDDYIRAFLRPYTTAA